MRHHLPAVGAGENNLDLGPDALRLGDDLAARGSRQGHIQQNEVDVVRVLVEKVHRGVTITRAEYRKTSPGKQF